MKKLSINICDAFDFYGVERTFEMCKKNGFDGKLFQTSFYEHIIRGQEDYDEIAKYIYENPMQWYCDELYAEE